MIAFTEIEMKERFGVRVYGLPFVPIDRRTLIASRMGIRRMIAREENKIEQEVDLDLINKMKGRVKQLRTIRNDLKKHLKSL